MANLSLLADLTVFPITRQNIFDMWTTSDLQSITTDDLADELATVDSGSDFSNATLTPVPGQFFYHLAENLVYGWFDEVDNTGVSLWLAIGPDRFEVPCLAAEPIPAGAPVDLIYDKVVGLPTEPHPVPMGFNQSGINKPQNINDGPDFGGDTTVSGAWCRIAIDGIVWGRIENPQSNLSEGLVSIPSSRPICMDPQDPTSLIEGTSWATPLFNCVGASVYNAQPGVGNLVPTEPTHMLRFRFAPRVIVPF